MISGGHNSTMITDRQKFATEITLCGISSFRFTVGINSNSFPWPIHSVQETSPNFLRRRVKNTADNADITQSQAANYHRLLSHVTLGLVECRKKRLVDRSPSASSRILYCEHFAQYSHSVLFSPVWDWRSTLQNWRFCQIQNHVTQKLGQISKIHPDQI